MIVKYESEADASFYCYFIKSGTPFSIHPDVKFTIKAAPHFHRNIELLFITEGEQNVIVDGNNYHLKAGDILFVNSYEPHSYDDCEAEKLSAQADCDQLQEKIKYIEANNISDKEWQDHLENVIEQIRNLADDVVNPKPATNEIKENVMKRTGDYNVSGENIGV